jgi:hypothetical protein
VHFEKDDLGHDGTEFPTRSCEAVCGRAIARGEDLAGNDERRHVRSKVAEEIRQAVQCDERLGLSLKIGVGIGTGIDASLIGCNFQMSLFCFTENHRKILT